MNECGIVVIRKEKGFTSHDVVAVVKRTFKAKAGHTGTLDPQAEGVLPVCVGKATRLAGYLAADNKAYSATVHLGVTTDTGDTSGSVLTSDPFDFNTGRICEAVSSFKGEQFQTPPMYSAIKVNGRKLYELARKGEVVEREPRRVIINSIEVTAVNPETRTFTMNVECSKGTYIRSLCEDIGKALGCGACMGDLLRTRSGVFTLDKSVRLRDLTEAEMLAPQEVLRYPRADALPGAEKLTLNGNPVPVRLAEINEAGEFLWLYLDGKLIGLYKTVNGFLTPEVMMI